MASQLAPCLRSELGVPMIVFGGVLLLSTAFCGVVDAINPHTFAEEVQVVRAENVMVGPEADLMSACDKDRSTHSRDLRCDHKASRARLQIKLPRNLQSASLH